MLNLFFITENYVLPHELCEFKSGKTTKVKNLVKLTFHPKQRQIFFIFTFYNFIED